MIRQLEPDLFLIDHEFQGVPGTIVSYLLTDGDDLTLIETGPATTMDTLLAGVRAAGFDPDQITRLIVTHIHLDHAGGAGSLIQRLPRARLFVHRVGAPHMVDPSKLLSSATRIFEEDMERLWGEILPVPEDRVVVLDDEATLRVGDRVLEALHTPGHASHHLAFHDAERGVIFTGDVAGAIRAIREIDAGNIHINWTPLWRADLMPYGGLKGSGIGKEGPRTAVAEMTEEKTVVLHGRPW
jgi:glyoxylase-like metal-dependent hydrolase (beta-lactamase superfamily II)